MANKLPQEIRHFYTTLFLNFSKIKNIRKIKKLKSFFQVKLNHIQSITSISNIRCQFLQEANGKLRTK